MRKFLKNQKGITMMEVLVTVALLAIVVVPCLSSFIVAQRGNVLAEQTYNEYTYAANLAEELKALPVPAGKDWREAVEDKLSEVNQDGQDNISTFVEFKDGGSYCEIFIYTGEMTEMPVDGEQPILKGVITP
ncbi:MAG: prepilin-type N-terminal cleavage/methylation domain-containing protein [Ruminococcaceae bacterium]|nr:prepilin-type N-terminal cleavage/methylation domain-containing protein [Oscillospiraceae bacterium]